MPSPRSDHSGECARVRPECECTHITPRGVPACVCDCVRPKTALCNPQHSEWAHTEVCCMNERAHRHTSLKCLNLKLSWVMLKNCLWQLLGNSSEPSTWIMESPSRARPICDTNSSISKHATPSSCHDRYCPWELRAACAGVSWLNQYSRFSSSSSTSESRLVPIPCACPAPPSKGESRAS